MLSRHTVTLKIRNRWPALALAGVLTAGVAIGMARLRSAVEQQLPGLLRDRLAAALNRDVEVGAIHVTPLGVYVRDLRVLKGPGEREDPLVAKSTRVSVDWWQLLSDRTVRVTGAEISDARVRLTETGEGVAGKPWTKQVLALSSTGLHRIGLRNASFQMLPKSGEATWSTEGASGQLVLGSQGFHYEATAKKFSHPEVVLTGLSVEGDGDADGIKLASGDGVYQGARFKASGTLKAIGNEALMTLSVRQMPLDRLASQLGIPTEWAMQGSVSGNVTIDARDNSLRSIQGTVDVARGSLTRGGGELPWRSAHAELDWKPELAQFRNVRIQGDGVTLTSNGSVALEPGAPFTSGRIHATGEIAAETSAAVAQVADLLAFRKALEGRWSAGGAKVSFVADGEVDKLEAATATGHLHVDNLRFRPMADSEPVNVEQLDADLNRSPERLSFTSVQASTQGLKVRGEVQLTHASPGGGTEFAASGSVAVGDLKSLRQAIPHASLWRWVPAISASAKGQLEFRAGGPVGDSSALWSDGRFALRDFRLGAQSSLPSGAMFFIPVQVASGKFRHAHRRLEVSDLKLDTATFDAAGDLAVDFAVLEPVVTTALTVRTDNWRSLPAMPPGVLPELQGGSLEGDLHLTGKIARFGQSEITGGFAILNARYATHDGADSIPVERLGARFRWAAADPGRERKLQLSEVKLTSPVLEASAEGEAYPVNGEYRLALAITAETPGAGELVRRITGDRQLTGGRANATLTIDAPVKRLGTGTLAGTVALQDFAVERPIEALRLARVDGESLEIAFEATEDGLTFRSVELKAKGLSASVSGSVLGGTVDAQLKLHSATWLGPEALPAAGGALDLAGTLRGDVKHPDELAFDGELQINGAHTAYRNASLALSGGDVSATLRGAGPFADPMRWLRSGSLALQGATLTRTGRASLPLEQAAATFVREGETFRVSDAKLAMAGTTASAHGEWSPTGHVVNFTATAADLSRLGIALPESLQVGQYGVSGTLTGTPERPLAQIQGLLDLRNVQLALNRGSALGMSSLSSAFVYDGDRLQLTNLAGNGPAGTLIGSGEWSPRGHQLTVALTGSDPSAFGIDLAAGYGVGGFAVQASVSGTPRQPLTVAEGTVRLENARFRFGAGGTQRLDRVATRFVLSDGNITLSELEATGPAGAYTGTGLVENGGYRLSLLSPVVNPDLVRWLVPGTMAGGKLSGTLVLEGKTSEALPTLATGRFEYRDGHYSAPAALGLLGQPIGITRLAADYRWKLGRTRLENIALESGLGTATGSLDASEGTGRLLSSIVASDVGLVADRWPVLNGRVRGGSGTGELELRFDPTGVRGTLNVSAKSGTLLLPGETLEYGEQPMVTGTGMLGFEPGKLTFTDVKLRGPKANLDGSGVWTDNGAVYGSGKAWFSRSYTSKLIKPSGWGWLAKLVGIREFKSDFAVSGTSDQVNLKAGITGSVLWKLAKGKVPKEFQQIAAGKSPLWVRPLTVVQTPTAASPVPDVRTGGE